jgi:hypothetical protein
VLLEAVIVGSVSKLDWNGDFIDNLGLHIALHQDAMEKTLVRAQSEKFRSSPPEHQRFHRLTPHTRRHYQRH